MKHKRLGRRTVQLKNPPTIRSWASVVGKTEGKGPLRDTFDFIGNDSYFGQPTWEQGESEMHKQCFHLACKKSSISPADLDYILSGDLLNQCVGSYLSLSCLPYFYLCNF